MLQLTLLHFLNLFEDYFILRAHKGVQVRLGAQLTGVSRFFHHVGPGDGAQVRWGDARPEQRLRLMCFVVSVSC